MPQLAKMTLTNRSMSTLIQFKFTIQVDLPNLCPIFSAKARELATLTGILRFNL